VESSISLRTITFVLQNVTVHAKKMQLVLSINLWYEIVVNSGVKDL